MKNCRQSVVLLQAGNMRRAGSSLTSGCGASDGFQSAMQEVNTLRGCSHACLESREGRKIKFPLPGKALNSNEGGPEM